MTCINSITICPENITIKKGKWYYGAYAEICPTNATCKCLVWHSSNSNVASVTEYGYICGVSEGAAVIYATATDGSGTIGFCNVTVVNQTQISTITVSPSTKNARVGDVFELSTIICPEDADDKRIRWTSCDSNIAAVDYLTGCVTAKSAGTTSICANAADGSNVYGYCSVTVQNVPVGNITITPANKQMAVGSATTLTVTVLPTNATNKTIVWSSSDENIATVNPTTGYVLAKNPGTTTIRASSQDGSNQYMNCTITVNNLYDIDTDSWEEMGFKYGNNESFNVNHNLPPISYQNWILNGRQKVIYLCDHDDVPIAGHSCLLIRSSEGRWYKTQFRGKTPSTSYIECIPIIEERKNEYLGYNNMEKLFLYGDYTESLEKAKEIEANDNNNYNGKYDLLTNNCLHYVNEILSYGDNINEEINEYIKNNNQDVPHLYYLFLKNILER